MEMFCFIVCFGLWQPAKPTVVDSFCQTYQRAIVAKPDAEAAKTLPPGLQRRIASNEVVYRCLCQKWSNPICAKVTPDGPPPKSLMAPST